jgi:LuxR family maltose regulon positive regulatory protein
MRTNAAEIQAVQWRGRSLQTELPEIPAHIVRRERLVDSVTTGLESPGRALVVLSAPAGYGKTMVLSQWMSAAVAAGRAVGWCPLDRDDRDPVVFWQSVLAAVHSAAEATSTARAATSRPVEPLVLPELPTPLDPSSNGTFEPRDRRTFLSDVRTALQTLEPGTALVLDDTHFLTGSASEEEFLALLALCPATVHIVFATRTAPSDQQARLTRRVWEIDALTLLFTRSETAELFDRFDVDESLVDKVFSASEGWPAVLGLAVPGLADAPRRNVTKNLLDPDAVYEYLDREIFEQLDPHDQHTVLACAISPVISADLANTILGHESSALSLRRLARNNPMLRRVSTDSRDRPQYRVNPVFGEFLREKLLGSQPDLLRTGTERAVHWHLAHGDPRAALRLAVTLGEPKLVHAVVRRVGCELVADGHAADLLALGSTGRANFLDDPFTPLMMAFAAVSSGKVERAEETLASAVSDGLDDKDALEWDWLRYVVVLRIALTLGEPVRALSSGWTDQTISVLPPSLRAAIHLTRGLVRSRDGEVSARAELEAARVTAESSGDLAGEVMSEVALASAALGRADIRESVLRAEHAVALAAEGDAQDLSLSLAGAHALIAWGRFQMVDVADATSHADTAMRFAAEQPLDEVTRYVRHVHQFIGFDDLPDRRRIAQDYTAAWPPSYLQQAPATLVVPSLHVGLHMARVLLEPRWIERLLDRARSVLGEGYDWRVASALVHYSMGRSASARAILSPLLGDSPHLASASSEIIAWSLDSVLEYQSGNPFRAHEAMSRALRRADETGAFVEVLRSDAPVVRAVLTRGLDRFGEHIPVADQLIAAGMHSVDPSVGHLTPKERELLAELRSLRTVAEISSDMLLSVNTVKTHMRGIYRKLNVSSRRKAVAEGERRGLI